MTAARRLAGYRASGAGVRVRHERPCRGFTPPVLLAKHELREENASCEHLEPLEFLPRGGRTTVRITRSDGSYGEGVAVCSPADGFCRRTGLELATLRAELSIIELLDPRLSRLFGSVFSLLGEVPA